MIKEKLCLVSENKENFKVEGNNHQLIDELTDRESEILNLIARGMTNQQIADMLVITLNTVKWHNKHIYPKLGVKSRTHAIIRARELGLLERPGVQRLTNLPSAQPELVGRDRIITRIQSYLIQPDCRLITLLGPPGIGKTQLSLRIAMQLTDHFTHGVFLVKLAPVTDSKGVITKIANTLKIPQTEPEQSFEYLKDYLKNKEILIVLDNFEQVLSASSYVAQLLSTCPQLTLLITSREPLRILAERQFPVPVLSLPDAICSEEVDRLQLFASVKLFVKRARAVNPDFELTQENATTIATICNRLDGLPLAIELISARIKILTPHALLKHLDGRLILHSEGHRDTNTRHRTLNNAIDWSYQLLEEDEKRLFRRLGIFSGGWNLNTAQAICKGNVEVNTLDGLSALLDKNLIKSDSVVGQEPHFIMLETIRVYALEQLRLQDELDELHGLHANYFAKWAERVCVDSSETTPSKLFEPLANEHDNLILALNWCQSHNVDLGLHLATVLCDYWRMRGYAQEGKAYIQKFLRADATIAERKSKLWANALTIIAWLAYICGDVTQLRHWATKALHFSRKIDDKKNILWSLRSLGRSAAIREDYEEANRLFTEGLELARETNDLYIMCFFLRTLGTLTRNQGDYLQALNYHNEALHIFRNNCNEIAILEIRILWETGTSALFNHEYIQAEQCYMDCLALSHEDVDIAYCLEGFAGLAAFQMQPERAARLLGSADTIRASSKTPRVQLDQYHATFIRLIYQQLDTGAFDRAWEQGCAFSQQEAIAYAVDLETAPSI